jgi:hypothetical protein
MNTWRRAWRRGGPARTYKSRGRPKPTDLGSIFWLQEQSALKWPSRSHTDSDLGDLYMYEKLRR